jgi:hypothetical protein
MSTEVDRKAAAVGAKAQLRSFGCWTGVPLWDFHRSFLLRAW